MERTRGGELYDVLIIGGGISGLGIALESARAGFKVVLLEKGAFAAATSANSLRILHGGFRYLQSLDFPRVLESLQAKDRLLREAAGFVRPLPCLMPLSRWGLKSALPVLAGCGVYRLIGALLRAPSAYSTVVSASYVNAHSELLAGMTPYGALLWHDAEVHDLKGFTAWLVTEARALGAKLFSEMQALGISESGANFEVCCEKETFYSKTVINACGPWLQTINAGAGPKIAWCKAFNLLFKRRISHAVGLTSLSGRLFFAAPRDSGMAAGTAYLPFCGLPDGVAIAPSEQKAFLAGLNEAFPGARFSDAEIVGVEVGVLPQDTANKKEVLPLSKRVLCKRGGYIEVLSTKYTTFLPQAGQVLKLIKQELARR